MDQEAINNIRDTMATIKTPISPSGFGMRIDIPIERLLTIPTIKNTEGCTGCNESNIVFSRLTGGTGTELSLSSPELEEKIKWRDYLLNCVSK